LGEDYWKFSDSERHFNETQAGIRNLASGLLYRNFEWAFGKQVTVAGLEI
jgi:hypothetical protein